MVCVALSNNPMLQQTHPNKIRQYLFLAILILLLIAIVREMYFLFSAFLGAVTLYVLLRNFQHRLVVDFRWKKGLAALFLILSSLLAIVLPSTLFISFMIDKVSPLLSNPAPINAAFHTIHDYLILHYKIDIFKPENIAKLNAQIVPMLQKTLGNTLNAVGNVVVMYLLLYFMLSESMSIELWLRNHVPFKNRNVSKLIKECRSMVYSNAVGIPIVAVLQGITGLIGYWIFGVQDALLMGLLTTICSVIPVVGSMAVFLPLGIYQLAIGHTGSGIGVLLWGLLLIGSVDNVARFMLQKRLADVHPLITIFGVIIGINLFGFLGLIFGPLLLSLFILLVRIYLDEFGTANVNDHPSTMDETAPETST